MAAITEDFLADGSPTNIDQIKVGTRYPLMRRDPRPIVEATAAIRENVKYSWLVPSMAALLVRASANSAGKIALTSKAGRDTLPAAISSITD
jgi:hypothetical protein